MKAKFHLAAAVVMALLTGTIAAIRPAAAQTWPSRPITIVVPFEPGGSVDRLGRSLATYLGKELGQPMTVVNMAGAGGQVGATWLLQQPDDGYTMMVMPAMPYLGVNILITRAKYTLDDFAFVNAQWSDFLVLAEQKDRPWQTAKDLLDAIKANPGKYSVGVDFGSTGHFSSLMLLEALGLPPSAIRIVTFDGGGTLRTALAGGQIDFSILQAEGSDAVKELIRPLAVILDKRSPLFDAPPINDVLKPAYGVTVPLLSGSIRALITSEAFRKKHPADFEKLAAAYKKALESPEFQAYLKTNKMAGEWLGTEASTDKIKTNFEVLKKYQSYLKN